jgi:O-antigen/teichoic acid export membrane protein
VTAARQPGDPDRPPSVAPTSPAGAVEAVEAAVEGLPDALTLASSSVVPAIGEELVLPGAEEAPGGAGTLGGDSMRTGLLQAGPLAVAGLVSNGANVVATVLLARLLTNRGYGSLNQLTGLFLIVSMPGSAVIVAVVRRITAWRASGDTHVVQRWAQRWHRRGTVGVLALAVAVLVAGPSIAGLLNQGDPVGAEAVLIAGAVWVVLCLDRGLLQADRRYGALSANLLIEGGVRTAAMLTLVSAGAGVSGAALGMLLAELATAAHARWMADRAWAPATGRPPMRALPRADPEQLAKTHLLRRDLVVDLVAALVALSLVAFLQNIDVITLGRDAPRVSGSYAAVSVASKAIVFGALVLGGYLLPEAAIRWRQGGHALRQLAVTLALLGVPAGLLLVLALGAPHLLLSVVFSSRYLGAQRAFPDLVAAMICLSVTVVLTMYLLAVGRRWITVALVAGAVAAAVAVALAHGAPRATARADLEVQAALAMVTMGGFARVHHRRLRRS